MFNLNNKRLKNDFQKLQKEKTENILLVSCNDDMSTWEAVLKGPKDSIYENGIFLLELSFPSDYPFKPPKIRFRTPVYHPNIKPSGDICLDILSSKWSASLTVLSVLLSICSLLSDPNADDPLNSEAAGVYKKDKNLFNRTVKDWIEKYNHKI